MDKYHKLRYDLAKESVAQLRESLDDIVSDTDAIDTPILGEIHDTLIEDLEYITRHLKELGEEYERRVELDKEDLVRKQNGFINNLNDFSEGRKVFGWVFEKERFNTLAFHHDDNDWTIFATPFWEDCEGIPVQATNPDGEVVELDTLKFELSDNYQIDSERFFTLMWEHMADWQNTLAKKTEEIG